MIADHAGFTVFTCSCLAVLAHDPLRAEFILRRTIHQLAAVAAHASRRIAWVVAIQNASRRFPDVIVLAFAGVVIELVSPARGPQFTDTGRVCNSQAWIGIATVSSAGGPVTASMVVAGAAAMTKVVKIVAILVVVFIAGIVWATVK